MPIIRIPAPLRAQTGGRSEVAVTGATAGDALAELARLHPGLADRVLDDRGGLPRFLNLFVGEDDVRDLQGLRTSLADDDVLSLVPAVAGG